VAAVGARKDLGHRRPAIDGQVTRVAMLSLHTSPLDLPGTGDAGGMNTYLKGVTAALGQAGLAVDIYARATLPDHLDQPAVDLAPLVQVHRIAAGPLGPVDKKALEPDIAAEFADQVSRGQPADLVHSHYWLSGLAGRQVATDWQVPHVQSLHTVAALKNRNLAPGDSPEGPRRLAAEAELVRGADAVVAVSPAEAAAITAHLGAPASKITVVTPGVDTVRFGPGDPGHLVGLPAALKRSQGYVLMVGRIQPIKGQDLAIRALAAIESSHRPALLVSGAPSSAHLGYASSLMELCVELGVRDDVVFLGAVTMDRLAGLMRGARLTLMPSHSETYGLVALESAACGTPVIGYSTTGLRSSVVDNATGILLQTREPQAWAAAIVQLAWDSDLRTRLSQGGVEHGRRNTWGRAATALLRLYNEVGACPVQACAAARA